MGRINLSYIDAIDPDGEPRITDLLEDRPDYW